MTWAPAATPSIPDGWGQDALRNAIDESLKKHLENGDIKAIYEKYVGEDLSRRTNTLEGAEFRAWNVPQPLVQNRCRSC